MKNPQPFQNLSESEQRAFCMMKDVPANSLLGFCIKHAMKNANDEKIKNAISEIKSMNEVNPHAIEGVLGQAYESILRA